jgi:cobalt-precorrin-5B (C1)-methyltransferase
MTFEPDLPEEMIKKSGLRTGYTTGTCASAAAKAAAIMLLTGIRPNSVEVELANKTRASFEVIGPEDDDPRPSAVVIKDAGDDPDCTDGAKMTAHVKWAEGQKDHKLTAGKGIGIVTMEGLGIKVGEPSITAVPRKMILKALNEVTSRPIECEFSVPGGEEMAKKTTNDRLGIIGGISILGTTGIVKPFSTAAFRASVVQQISVAAHQGHKTMILATGYLTESFAMRKWDDLPKVCFVEIGDFSGIALRQCKNKGFTQVKLVAMAGKITKLAAGIFMTHYKRSNVDTDLLKRAAQLKNADQKIVDAALSTNTARHFAETCIELNNLEPLIYLTHLAKENCISHVSGGIDIEVYMTDFEGKKLLAHA